MRITLKFDLISSRLLIATLLIALTQGCAHFELDGCGAQEVSERKDFHRSPLVGLFGDSLIGVNEPRIRSSHYRMVLANPAAAAQRFYPYAMMSSLAYDEEKPCLIAMPRKEGEIKISSTIREKYKKNLSDLDWEEELGAMGSDAQNLDHRCEDDTGMFYRVFKKKTDSGLDIAVAFRGTWGAKDWFDGNLHWINRLISREDQYNRAKAAMKAVIERHKNRKNVRFYTTGHSLGGGLAQHALYSFPEDVIQTIAFAPSSATGFKDQDLSEQIEGCKCDQTFLEGRFKGEAKLPDGETRIYRIYDSREILANLRIFHKVFFPPERHVQEVRFENDVSEKAPLEKDGDAKKSSTELQTAKANNDQSSASLPDKGWLATYFGGFLGGNNMVKRHGMVRLTEHFEALKNDPKITLDGRISVPWYAGIGTDGKGQQCTDRFKSQQVSSCTLKVNKKNKYFLCPA